jgi:flagellar hook protein FlgE
METLYPLIQGAKVGQKQVEIAGSNISRQAVIAGKELRVDVTDFPVSGSVNQNQQLSTGPQISAIQTDFTPGPKWVTQKQSDLYINGEGWLQVKDEVSNRFYLTRAGNLKESLETQKGMKLQVYMYNAQNLPTYQVHNNEVAWQDPAQAANPNDPMPGAVGSLNLDLNDLRKVSTGYVVDSAGKLSLKFDGRSPVAIGQILLAKVNNPQALVNQGDGLYSFSSAGIQDFNLDNATPGSGGLGTLQQGALELSTVNFMNCTAQAMMGSLNTQMCANMMTVANDTLKATANIMR